MKLAFVKQEIRKAANKGFFHFLSARFLIKFFGFGSQLFVAWWLTPEDIGAIKIMQVYISVLVVLAGFGFNISTLKLCSEDREEGEKRHFFKSAFKYNAVSAIVVVLLALIAAYFNLFSPEKRINTLMMIFVLGLIPYSLNRLFLSYYQARKKIKTLAKYQMISKAISILFVIGFTYLFAINGYVTGIIVGYSLTFILLFFADKKENKGKYKKTVATLKKHWKYSVPSLFTNLLGIITLGLDLLMLNYLHPDRQEIGYYGFAVLFIGFLRMVSTSVNQVSMPYFSNMMNNPARNKAKLKEYQSKNIKLGILLLIASNVFVLILMKYGFNGKYEDSLIYFPILSVAWFFRHLVSMRGSFFLGIGKIKINLIISFWGIIFGISLLFISIKLYEVIGAAFAMIVTNVFLYILNLIYYKRIAKYYNG